MDSESTVSEAELTVSANMAAVAISPDGVEMRSAHNDVFDAGLKSVATFVAPTASQRPIEELALGTGGGTSVSTPELATPEENTPVRSSTQTVTADGRVVARLRAFVPSLLTISDPVDELGFRVSNGDLFNRVTFNSGVDLSGTDTVLVATGEFQIGES
jgi:hypothetical protein